MDKIKLETIEEKIDKNNNPLKCSICKNYLSVPPIFHNATLGNICGRKSCENFSETEGTARQTAYEVLAMFMEFPCFNKENGCDQILPWNEVKKHEEECEFKLILCPFSLEKFKNVEENCCEWKGNISEFLEHMKEIHSKSEFKNCFTMDIRDPIKSDQVFFSVMKDEIVVVVALVDLHSISHWKIWAGLKIHHNLKYKCEFYSEKGKREIKSKLLTPQPLQPAFYKTELDNSWFQLNSHFIKNFFECSNSFVIKFYLNDFQLDPYCLTRPNISIPNFLICYRCKYEVISSYYICSKKCKQIYCQTCAKILSDLCAICRSNLKRISHDSWKSIIGQSLEYCEVCNIHSQFPFSHLQESHKESLLELDKFYLCQTPSQNFFFYDDHLFLFSINITSSGDLSLFVKCCNSNNIKYSYKLKLTCSVTPICGITISKAVLPQFLHSIGTSDPTNETLIPKNLLDKIFHSKLHIKFKMRISTL